MQTESLKDTKRITTTIAAAKILIVGKLHQTLISLNDSIT